MLKTISKLQLLDVVAIKEDLPSGNLLAGQVGTIVEFLAPEVYEVEFSDDDGQTYAMLPLHSSQLLQLKYKYTPETTPMSNNIYQYGQGDNVGGDKVAGDKVGGDKIINNANTAEILKLISSMRESATQFPEDIRDGIIIDIEDVEAEIKKPESQWNKARLKKSLTAMIGAATAIAIPIAGAVDFASSAIDLGQKVGIEIKLPPAR
ncbi:MULTISPECIES: DUF4926 domain-containing protein [unclassified Microcoleus]|uniref:DUF4926 domain-containing protein n=1 Tax=unclassified Microcoleus TaxID=2642155 RepID=UPI001DA65DF8|nr:MULTISPECIES: DUF4926 domain-containing protein [unclassified Microcoleus]MCC3567445.1 DUF4926 domain-containing protein [Microcoleus sp. PH2017_31_RDM_U_A]MCC3579823.1 DUF4926 domain-containing protein [Microcoleus sp. PH2017_32_RDM_D_A]MCC3617912.1 DUF4926 domain-containing protein [Microcoleus sp. PH2017_38_RDM_U_B]